jgi:hypothetical protein
VSGHHRRLRITCYGDAYLASIGKYFKNEQSVVVVKVLPVYSFEINDLD